MKNPYDLGSDLGRLYADILMEAAPKKRVVAILSGRFQPFHAGHFYVYDFLARKFGANNTYIGTSNVVEPPRSPFSFADKKKIITTLFPIPSSNVQQLQNPFQPTEILNRFDPKTTVYVTAFGEKDAGRLTHGKYFKEFPSNGDIDSLEGYKDAGYYIVMPLGAGGISGTQVRATFSDPKVDVKKKEELFRQMYNGKFNKPIFDLIIQRLGGKLKEGTSMISRVLIEKYHTNQWRRRILMEGGAAGHLAHPFEDANLTFGDMKKMIESGLEGGLNVEAPVTEKLDGQNISISYRKDKGVIFARNKSHIKDSGVNGMPVSGIKQMFAGRGELSDAFGSAADDMERAILSLSEKQREKIFSNGQKFMSVEIIYPATQNVIPYGLNLLVFHNTIEFDKSGEPVGTSQEDARMLAGMIKQINQDIQKTFTFRGPVVVSLPRSENFAQRKSHFLGKLARIQSQFGLKDSDSLMMWHQRWWEEFITDQATKMKYAMPNNVLEGLLKRWAFLDTGAFPIAAMKSVITSSDFLDWVTSYDKTNHAAQFKKNVEPLEMLFLELGTEILENARGLISISPGDAADRLRKDLDNAVKELSSTTDVKKMAKVKDNLQKIQALGTERLVPSEGIVFVFHGKMYKLTGEFAPLNQILGALKY